ncbi:NAD(P)-binding protein [Mucidula mucida]|nr:NAD(P)-binding protein [Mucidula mucida]
MLFPPVARAHASGTPLRFGILGAANIAPQALILPAKSHPEVVVYAVAARNRARAEAFAKKHEIPKVHADYQALLDDPDVDVVYNPLPNGLHYEWTMKALIAGKHVLLEKPSANTAEETRAMFELAEKKGLVLLEAFHYRFHPAIQRLKAIIVSNELGKVKSITTRMWAPTRLAFSEDDIRFDFALGGGALMDMGCYALNSMRFLASPFENTAVSPTEVIAASSIALVKPQVDRGTTATLAFPNDIVGTLTADLNVPFRDGISMTASVVCEGGEAELFNFVLPTVYHTITVKKDGQVRKEKAYVPGYKDGVKGKGEDWWSTYRYQLETFVDRLKGRDTGKEVAWVTMEDSIANIEWIEKIYEKSGLGSRPKSTYVPPAL